MYFLTKVCIQLREKALYLRIFNKRWLILFKETCLYVKKSVVLEAERRAAETGAKQVPYSDTFRNRFEVQDQPIRRPRSTDSKARGKRFKGKGKTIQRKRESKGIQARFFTTLLEEKDGLSCHIGFAVTDIWAVLRGTLKETA